MPLYEYECPECGHIVEVQLSMAERSDPGTAPSCMSHGHDPVSMKPIISRTSFSLKGDGWYRDGYSKNSKPEE